jgi:hypothetical protein
MEVPPTPTTSGWAAGSPADSTDRFTGSRSQPVDPVSPAAAKRVWPCATACSARTR